MKNRLNENAHKILNWPYLLLKKLQYNYIAFQEFTRCKNELDNSIGRDCMIKKSDIPIHFLDQ